MATPCTGCSTPVDDGAAHRFEDVRGKRIAVYCDACCPRCWADRREEKPA